MTKKSIIFDAFLCVFADFYKAKLLYSEASFAAFFFAFKSALVLML